MTDKRPLSIAFLRIAELAGTMGLGKGELARREGVWRYTLSTDTRWFLTVNAHKEEVEKIPAFTAYVEFNGWPFGFIDPFGGTMGAGEVANEDALIAALEAEILRYGAEVEVPV